jgi:tRNA G18 (ribose-2'-O)-methylase SpoU
MTPDFLFSRIRLHGSGWWDVMHLVHIDSIEDMQIAEYTHLTELQLRNRLEPEKGVFIAESPKVITRALDAGVEVKSFLVEEPWLDGMSDTFAFVDAHWGPDIPVYVATPEQLKRITGYRLHRGALSAMKRWTLPSVRELCRDATRIAVMENIVDHTNVGAIMRSAAALNIDAVLLTPSCADPLYRRAARVSMGTVFQVPWTRICDDDKSTWPEQGVEELHDLGFTTAAMALEHDSISMSALVSRLHSDPQDPRHIGKLALIFGTEGDGLSHRTIAHADLTVKIAMSHGVDSLNVAASSAVAFWATSGMQAE